MPKPFGETLLDLCEGLHMPPPRRGSFDVDGCSKHDGTQHGPKGKPYLPNELIGQPEGGKCCEHANDAAERLIVLCGSIKSSDANKLATSLGSTSMDLEAIIAMFWARRANDDSKDAMLCADPKHKGKNKRLHLVGKTHAQCAASPISATNALPVISFSHSAMCLHCLRRKRQRGEDSKGVAKDLQQITAGRTLAAEILGARHTPQACIRQCWACNHRQYLGKDKKRPKEVEFKCPEPNCGHVFVYTREELVLALP